MPEMRKKFLVFGIFFYLMVRIMVMRAETVLGGQVMSNWKEKAAQAVRQFKVYLNDYAPSVAREAVEELYSLIWDCEIHDRMTEEGLKEAVRRAKGFADTPKNVFAVCLEGDEILVCCRPDGTLGLPGGKVESCELPTRALRREAREEGVILDRIAPEPIYWALVEGVPTVWHVCTFKEFVDPREEDLKRGIRSYFVTIPYFVSVSPKHLKNQEVLDLLI
ncbi:NUDIX domain-containing protein [Candidatus Parcubacteria bacterium]|nr:MAG: NUDIX domain-containing protein [Candidatus Parcubacteria bacterium]